MSTYVVRQIESVKIMSESLMRLLVKSSISEQQVYIRHISKKARDHAATIAIVQPDAVVELFRRITRCSSKRTVKSIINKI
jgi:hypothetical protein